ncbi:MAG TPA: HDIG domain-containing protein, partial [Saprospiraceae bacterium]|nr:HDIG domain-containing protein [Saprospiraceae bacterium]
LVYYIEELQILSVYLLPFCIVPIVIKNFFGEHIAFITFLFVVIISSLLSTYGYEFTVIQLLAGIVAIVADFNPKNWMSFFKSLAYIAGVYLLTYFTLNLIETGDITLLDWQSGGWLLVSAFLNLLAYPFIPLFERIFGFTSSVRLGELADLERPLLKDLAIRAPGTFQHSLQVANLSEAAAKSIGANASLVRTAALYHDIGKMDQAKYFVENSDGTNYHKDLAPEESAKIIIDHVIKGAELARKKGLPSVITRFIRTHHGTTRVEYFYQKALKENEKVDVTQYTYPGPTPVSKEETLLMVADSLEAAAKAIQDPSIQDLEDLLEKIVRTKITLGQFEESALSFEELEIIKDSFLRTLKSIYHGRIKYPESQA